jgi:L-lactate dehydrogenase (cytochrome)
MNLGQLGRFMNQTFEGRITEDKLKRLRDKWKGKLVLKGVASEEDAQLAIGIGCDGLIVSNHGGRQLDAAEPAIESLRAIVKSHGDRLPVMMDSGIRSGIDIARVMACGAAFTFMGRSFMYSVAALGDRGGDHMMGMCKTQLRQVLQQTGCSSPLELPTRLIDRQNKV